MKRRVNCFIQYKFVMYDQYLISQFLNYLDCTILNIVVYDLFSNCLYKVIILYDQNKLRLLIVRSFGMILNILLYNLLFIWLSCTMDIVHYVTSSVRVNPTELGQDSNTQQRQIVLYNLLIPDKIRLVEGSHNQIIPTLNHLIVRSTDLNTFFNLIDLIN